MKKVRIRSWGHHHLPLWTTNGSIIARGNDHKVGLELDGDGQEDNVEDGQVVLGSTTYAVQSDVHVEALALCLADVVKVALSQVRPVGALLVSMHRHVDHSGIEVERLLRALTMMEVKVNNHDLFCTSL